uniref:ARHGAP20 PH domain-containing protein n=1 Tax=Eptatretus burgeri TaxID=7764 RepID=A0A8C4WYR7_EPTBU
MKENSRHGQDECPADAASVRTATKLKAKGLLQRRRSAPCGISIDVHLLRDAIRPSRYSLFNQLPLFPPEDLLGLESQIQASTQHACTKGGARLCSGPGVSESDARPRTLESFHYDVHLITGPRIQRRSIVIRGNSLFIAKSKLDSASRVKAHVRLQEAWVSSCVDEVCELSVPSDQAFVLGWPISNHVLLFSCTEHRNTCLTIFEEHNRQGEGEGGTQVHPTESGGTRHRRCRLCQNTRSKQYNNRPGSDTDGTPLLRHV